MVRTAAQRRGYESTQRDKRRARLNELKDVPCADCGVRYPPYVMHFDHRNGEDKLFNVGHYVNGGSINGRPLGGEKVRARGIRLALLLAEIDKCDVVCANCHAERTWGDGNGS